jgi:hypothetical protein
LRRHLAAQTASSGTPPGWPPNVGFSHTDLVDYWRLMRKAYVRPARHYLFYPNPWPKIGHLPRRWHGHPVFPALLALGGPLQPPIQQTLQTVRFIPYQITPKLRSHTPNTCAASTCVAPRFNLHTLP